MREKRIGTRELKLRKRIEALNEAGVIAWRGHRLHQAKPADKVREDKTIAELVIENRECLRLSTTQAASEIAGCPIGA